MAADRAVGDPENGPDRWTVPVGISGRNESESLDDIRRNTWTKCVGISQEELMNLIVNADMPIDEIQALTINLAPPNGD